MRPNYYDFFKTPEVGEEDAETWLFSEKQQAWDCYYLGQTISNSPDWALIFRAVNRCDFQFFLAFVKRKNKNAELKTADLLAAKKEIESIKANLQEIKATGWAGLMGKAKK